MTSPWWQRAIVYQVYVRSFADADGDGVGDLEGLRQRLGYIAALGADAIWLCPVYPSPQRDHGYDVADYIGIDAAYGDLATFDRLVATARDHGLRLLMDIVPNHCSDQHPWFQAGPRCRARGATSGPGSGSATALDGPPNNWPAVFGGSVWTPVGRRRPAVVPRHVHAVPARLRPSPPGGRGDVRRRPALLVRSRRRRLPGRRRVASRQGPGAARRRAARSRRVQHRHPLPSRGPRGVAAVAPGDRPRTWSSIPSAT